MMTLESIHVSPRVGSTTRRHSSAECKSSHLSMVQPLFLPETTPTLTTPMALPPPTTNRSRSRSRRRRRASSAPDPPQPNPIRSSSLTQVTRMTLAVSMVPPSFETKFWFWPWLGKLRALVETIWPDEIQGKYSVARLEAFEQYRNTRSSWWMVFLSGCHGLPAISVVVAMNFLPMQNTVEGWKRNYMVFVRMALIVLICAQCIRNQRIFYLTDKPTTVRFMYCIWLFIAGCVTGSLLLLSISVQFPMPFGLLFAALIGAPFAFATLRFFVKRVKPTHESNPGNRAQSSASLQSSGSGRGTRIMPLSREALAHKEFQASLKSYVRIAMFHFMLIFIFPIYYVFYQTLSGHQVSQIACIVLMPLLRKCLTVWHRRNCRRMPDLSNEIVIFSVKFFVTLFRSFFLTYTGWLGLTIVVIWDWIENVYFVVRIYLMLRSIEQIRDRLSQEADEHGQHTSASAPSGRTGHEDVLVECVAFLNENRRYVMNKAQDMRMVMKGSNTLAFYTRNTLTKLFPTDLNKVHHTSSRRFSRSSNSGDPPSIEALHRMEQAKQVRLLLLEKTLSLVFSLEYIALTEYVEAFVPFAYVYYAVLSYYSPCRPFLVNLHASPVEFQQTILQLVEYGALEVLSFVAICWVIRWRFRLNLMPFLAFVLETHFINIQSKMLFFMVFIMSFDLVHFGVDFTFKFRFNDYNSTVLSNAINK